MKVNNNWEAQYKVEARVMCGVSVVGFIVVDRNGNTKRVRKEAFEKLALDNKIFNCSANIYNNRVNLRGIGIKLKDLPVIKIKETVV